MMNAFPSDKSLSLKHKGVRVLGVILALLVLTALALQFFLHLGWKAYAGLDGIVGIAADGDGRVWVTGYQGPVGVLMLYQENRRPVQIPLPAELTRVSAGALMIDNQDRVWVGTDHGYVGMRDVDGKWILYSSSLNYSIWGLVMDGQGRVWARSHQGPGQIDPGASDRSFTFTNSGLPDSDAVAMATDEQGQLWVLTQKREVMVLEPGGIWRTYTTVPNTVNNSIFGSHLAVDKQGGIWLVNNAGVAVLDPGGEWMPYPLGDPTKPLSITAILPGPNGRVWVASENQGVFVFDPGPGWTNYTSLNSGLSSNFVTSLAYDADGRIWIGSSRGSLNRWDPDAASLARILPAMSLATQVILPAAILGVGLLALLRVASGRWGPVTGRKVRDFSFAFIGWFIGNALLWGWIRYSYDQSGGLAFIDPRALIPLPLNILFLLLLYATNRWMALGLLSAFTANWIVMILIAPFVDGSGASAILMIPFFLPLFLALRSSNEGSGNLPG
jgi:ligand-binding sensor domain-containing protein